MGESLKRRLDKEERDDSENEPHKKRESGKEPEKTHCCNNGSHTNEQNKHNLVTQNVIIENNGDDDDDDIWRANWMKHVIFRDETTNDNWYECQIIIFTNDEIKFFKNGKEIEIIIIKYNNKIQLRQSF